MEYFPSCLHCVFIWQASLLKPDSVALLASKHFLPFSKFSYLEVFFCLEGHVTSSPDCNSLPFPLKRRERTLWAGTNVGPDHLSILCFFFLLPLKMHSVDSSFLPSDECLGGITWLFCSCNYFQVPKEWKCAVWEIKEKKNPSNLVITLNLLPMPDCLHARPL